MDDNKMSEFLTFFDPKNEKHVLWLRDVGRGMKSMSDAKTKLDFEKVVNANPLGKDIKMKNMLDWAYVHFQLAMKYTNAVLENEAHVPKNIE